MLGAGFDNLQVLAGAAAGVWAEVQGNDFAERAVALVDEIQAASPDVVGLQELAEFVTLEVDLTNGSIGATGLVDFRAILEDEIRERRLPYSFVAVQENTSVTIPVAGIGDHPNFIPTHLVRLTIRDAVLVRRGINVRGVSQGNYQAMVSLGTPEDPIDLKRGWIRIDARVNGIPFHFVNTHLEIQPFALIQEMQVQELLTEIVPGLGGVTVQVEGVGDDPTAKTVPSDLWPSDHAGVVANLGLDRGRFGKFR
jgi:endonuclease/exonuclease/phosphatase family metal-dependent hydrolase